MHALTDVFLQLLSGNRNPGYGIKVVDAAADLSRIDVEIVFLAGRTYCCFESGCQLPRDSKRLVELAAVKSITIPEQVTVNWHFRIEDGAKHDCSGWMLASSAYEYDVVGMPPREKISD
jgi:hypothetical protein